jgi:predicted secreted protein
MNTELSDSAYLLDDVLYIKLDQPGLPAINEAAFLRLQELTEANRLLRALCRESADAYERGYHQALKDSAAVREGGKDPMNNDLRR